VLSDLCFQCTVSQPVDRSPGRRQASDYFKHRNRQPRSRWVIGHASSRVQSSDLASRWRCTMRALDRRSSGLFLSVRSLVVVDTQNDSGSYMCIAYSVDVQRDSSIGLNLLTFLIWRGGGQYFLSVNLVSNVGRRAAATAHQRRTCVTEKSSSSVAAAVWHSY
jgi:hypothetical protein